MHIERKRAALATALLLCSCGDFPRDPAGTLGQVRERGTIRVGLIAGGEAQHAKTEALVTRMARVAQAQPVQITGEAEPLLRKLEEGQLDLVLGTFDEKTPWNSRVTIGPPLERAVIGKVHFQLAPAMRNGENAWISLIEREVRDLAPGVR